MKKLKFWFMAMIAIVATATLTACSDDDEPAEKGLQGLWQNESFIHYFGSEGKGYMQYAPTNSAYESNSSKSYFDWFAADEVLSIRFDGNGFMSGSPSYYYEVDDDVLILINTNWGDISTYYRQ